LPKTKSNAALEEVLEKIGCSLVEAFMEFEF